MFGLARARSRAEGTAMFGRQARAVARVGVVASAAACLSATALAGAAVAGAIDQQILVGAWSGPGIGETGDCGPASAEFAFSPNGTYRYQAIYGGCPRVMIDGHYELQADGRVLQISMEECGDPGCPPGPSSLTTSISAIDPDNIVLDGRYAYRREHG
jgi:hypothetical protein